MFLHLLVVTIRIQLLGGKQPLILTAVLSLRITEVSNEDRSRLSGRASAKVTRGGVMGWGISRPFPDQFLQPSGQAKSPVCCGVTGTTMSIADACDICCKFQH